MSSENKKPTLKQKRFAKAVASGVGTVTDAVYQAGYTPKSRTNAHKIGYDLMRKPHVLEAINQALEAITNGDPEAAAAKTVVDIMTSTSEKSSDRLKAADMLLKVRGAYAPTKKASINVDVSDKWKLPEE
jgi:hypothetical protein